ncbi:MAG TPA: aldehyde dehydrogenase family protein [Pyrinomonadaceae bacterium]|nr:aldehyde dehydrogenase family protein [Pyrinomonadaceae bacterium]
MSIQTLPITRSAELVSRDPSTGDENGRVPILNAVEVSQAVEIARATQSSWASLSFDQRARIILKARELVLAEVDEIARLVSSETGKPALEAISMEIVPALDLMFYFAKNSERLLKKESINIALFGTMGRSSVIVYKPLGVVGVISPWNFPWATPLAEIVMALMAGNAVVVKPSELSPLTALKIEEVFAQAGLPEGLLQIVTGDGSTGAALIDAKVNKVMFTGSVATGKKIAERAAKYLIPVVLELGGKDPMIVLEDANLQVAARAAVWGAFCNSGQACASIERCYVHESIIEEFSGLVVEETRALRQGHPASEEVDVGAMTSEQQLETVEQHVNEAENMGARILIGGARGTQSAGWFYQPTVLTDVDHSMKLMREETFGPVLPIMPFRTDEEAIQLANDSIYGLTAAVFTTDLERGQRVARQLDAGTVMVNEVVYTHALAQTPWGGVKQSGYGRTHGKLGLLELVTPQHIHVNSIPYMADLWWFRYTNVAGRLFRGLARRFTTGSLVTATPLLPAMLRRLLEKRK